MLQCETEDVQLTAESLTLWPAFFRLAALTHSADSVMAKGMNPKGRFKTLHWLLRWTPNNCH